MKKQRVNIQIIPPPIHARHLLNWIRYETKSTLDMLLEIITHIIYEAIHITQIYADILQNVFSVILDSQFRYSSRTILTLANNWTDENKLRILSKIESIYQKWGIESAPCAKKLTSQTVNIEQFQSGFKWLNSEISHFCMESKRFQFIV